MTVDEFLAWAARQETATRFELLDGEPIAMAPELISHAETKTLIGARLVAEIASAGLPCRAIVDGPGVRTGRASLFIPDVLVHYGSRPPEAREVADPIIVIEVESPSTAWMDDGPKLIGYFAVPSIRHYLIVSPRRRAIIHHERRADGGIETHLRGEGPVPLDPPGLTLAEIFPPTQ